MEAVPQVLDGNARSLDSPRKGEVERLRVHIRSVLRDVLLSARSVRASHASVPLCLFTDVPEVEGADIKESLESVAACVSRRPI